jgi:hypothetical protein
MRWLVWSLAGCLLSCGGNSTSAGAGGRGAGGGGGVGGDEAAGTAGAPPMDAGNGGNGAHGGMLSSGGSAVGGAVNAGAASSGAPSGGGGGTSSAGSSGGDRVSGASGSAGQSEGGAGNAPAVECDGSYRECGCGCCVTDPPFPPAYSSCYYPDLGATVEAIKAADEAAAMSPSCANEGCVNGLERVCCIAPVEVAPAVYEATGYSGALDQMSITRTDDDRCTRANFAIPSSISQDFPLELPTNWGLEYAADCGGRTGMHRTIGAMGSLVFTNSDPCTASFDFTVFLSSETGEIEAVRFQSEAEVPGLLWCQ